MRSDLEDMIQIVLVAAWRAINADRYRPVAFCIYCGATRSFRKIESPIPLP